jgi:chemotaxis protein MotA
MDLLTIAGLFLAFSSVVLSNLLGGGEMILLINLPSAIIVVFGSLGASLVQSSVAEATRSLTLLKWAIFPPVFEFSNARELIYKLATQARRHSVVSLESELEAMNDVFSERALQMAIDGADPENFSDLLHDEVLRFRDKRMTSIDFLESIGGYAPTLGIMGSVLGLIQAMANLDSPEALGHGIAVAFVSTLYGQGFANLIIFPITKKISNYIDKETLYYQLIVDGVYGIATGKNPHRLDIELSGYEQ